MTDAPMVSVRMGHVLARANDEAARLQHPYIGTEHILLALAAERESVAVATLQNLGVDLGDLRFRIEGVVTRGRPEAKRLTARPYTSRAKRALDLAASAARAMGHSYVGAEHLLLGLLDESQNIAAQALGSAGVRADLARAEIGRLLSGPVPK